MIGFRARRVAHEEALVELLRSHSLWQFEPVVEAAVAGVDCETGLHSHRETTTLH